MWCNNGAVVAPTKINQGRRPIQQSGPPASELEPPPPRQHPHRGWIHRPTTRSPPPSKSSPTPPIQPQPSTGPHRPRRVRQRHILRLATVVPSCRPSVEPTCRAQRAWGVMTPRAQSPAMDDASSEGMEKEAALPKVVEVCSLVKWRGPGVHLPPQPEQQREPVATSKGGNRQQQQQYPPPPEQRRESDAISKGGKTDNNNNNILFGGGILMTRQYNIPVESFFTATIPCARV